MRKIHWLIGMVLLGIILATGAARAEVRDDGHFFSPAAVDQANRDTDKIQDQYGKQVLIETFAAIPDDLKSSYDPSQKAAFFERWADQRFKRDNVNGIYVLICKDPPYLRPLVGRDTGKGFTLADSITLGEKMRAQLGNKQPDAALTDGISFIQTTLAGVNTRPMASATPVGPGNGTPSYGPANGGGQSFPQNMPVAGHSMGILGWIILIGVIFIVIRVLRGLFGGLRNMTGGGMAGPGSMGGTMGGPMGGNYGGGYGAPSGGGFGRGLLGGLLGGVASSWLYNREENNSGGGLFGGGGGGGGGPIDTGSGGGGFGDSGGFSGNDNGVPMSGDSGGGSFGGGDSGGGGGDSSGGGSF